MSVQLPNSVLNWLAYAANDELVAFTIHHHLPSLKDYAAFHCQQSVEKYLKALLIYFNVLPPKTHDLPYLLELIEKHVIVSDALYSKAELLRSFAVEIRYPSGRYRAEDIDTLEVLEIVIVFKDWVNSVLKGT